MPARDADRNLIFGILAVQLDFVTRDQLIAAMNSWLLDKTRPLGEVFCERGDLPAEKFQHLNALVEAHLKRHGGDPQRSLAALSSIDATLRQKLGELPDVQVQATVMQLTQAQSDASPGHDSAARRPTSSPGPAAGRYRILKPYARGGLGEVFVAEDTELGREVALKQIQDRHADDLASRGRFVLEAEVTGGLEHPGIVPVYGLGSYADGRPFYAMRFIKGDNLKDAIAKFHANAPRFDSLAFRELLGRFVDVCQAMAYAHSRGVLHRDLKPGNIMLGKFGETLVVDWGLAKTLVHRESIDGGGDATLIPQSGGESSATIAGHALGTPAYMPPEQAAGDWDRLGPRSDVYSLGATLYELLTGRAPYESRVLEVLLEDVRQGRFPPPRRIAPSIPRPLEAVCLKAMARDPADRYGSTQELAGEIERWMADEPVTAWREPWSARLRRGVRKHSLFASGMTAALIVGLAALAVLAWQSDRSRRAIAQKEMETAQERDRANNERDVAREQKKRTRAALDTMISPEMVERLGTQKELTAGQRAFLQTALGYYREFATEADTGEAGRKLEADAQFRIAYLLKNLGEIAEAEPALRAASAGYERLAAEEPANPEYRRSLAVAHNNLGDICTKLNRLADAETEFRAAAALNERLAADHPEILLYRSNAAQNRHNLGIVFTRLGRNANAVQEFRTALAAQKQLAADHPAVADYRRAFANTSSSLGKSYHDSGQTEEAEKSYRAALEAQERLAAEFPTVAQYRSEMAWSLMSLARLLNDQSKYSEAEAAYRAGHAAQERLAADFPAIPAHRSALAANHNTLGVFLESRGKHSEAEAAFQNGLSTYERLTADYPGVPEYRNGLARSRNNMGTRFDKLGRNADAENAYRAALAVYDGLAADFPSMSEYRSGSARCQANLAQLFARIDRKTEAVAAYRIALSLREQIRAEQPDIPFYRLDADATAIALCNLLIVEGNTTEAVAIAGRILERPSPPANTLYDGACLFALASAAPNNPDTGAQAVRAVELLRQAFAKGYRDIPHMLKDSDLDSLRRRDDFSALMWELAEAPAAARRPSRQ